MLSPPNADVSRWDVVWEGTKRDAFILGFLLKLLGDEMELLGISA